MAYVAPEDRIENTTAEDVNWLLKNTEFDFPCEHPECRETAYYRVWPKTNMTTYRCRKHAAELVEMNGFPVVLECV